MCVTLTFDLETSMRVASIRGSFTPNLGTLGLRVLELFAMYATDGRTDGQKQRLLPPPLLTDGGTIRPRAHYTVTENILHSLSCDIQFLLYFSTRTLENKPVGDELTANPIIVCPVFIADVRRAIYS